MKNRGKIRAFLVDAVALAGLLACWFGLWWVAL
jgi:hypothetical protein